MPKIIVVDDEVEIVEIVCAAAHGLGLECIGFGRPEDFLAAVSDDVALAVLDIRIPRCDGAQLVRMLKDTGYRGALVFMSGVESRIVESAEALAREHGFDVVGRLSKPFSPETLQSVLSEGAAFVKRVSQKIKGNLSQISIDDLVLGIDSGGLELHYQPQIDLNSSQIIGLEALVRLRHPTLGLIYPDQFIPLAESNGQINHIGALVAEMAVSALPLVQQALASFPVMSINIAVQSLSDLDLPDKLANLAAKYGVNLENITLEITESGKITDTVSFLETMTRLKVKGFHLSLDDFGTGHAMMEQVQRVPADEIKIDRQFVENMKFSASALAIVRRIIDLGHDLNMNVVAEGIETSEQQNILLELGCDIGQGYLYSWPLPLQDFIKKYQKK